MPGAPQAIGCCLGVPTPAGEGWRAAVKDVNALRQKFPPGETSG